MKAYLITETSRSQWRVWSQKGEVPQGTRFRQSNVRPNPKDEIVSVVFESETVAEDRIPHENERNGDVTFYGPLPLLFLNATPIM